MAKYKIGYALSGGGARGFAHAGAIKALEELGIKPDIISGTSAGSIVGALYCSGKSPDEMMEIFSNKQLSNFISISIPKAGIFKSDYIIKFLQDTIPFENIENLPIPLYITATNFDKGESIVFKSGELAIRVMASCCIPILFKLIEIDGVHYADGGIFKNLPASPIRDICEIVIGIDVGATLPRYEDNLKFIGQQTYDYMARASVTEEKKLCDIVLETREVTHYSILSLKNAKEIYKIGYEAMKKTLTEISPELLKKLITP